MVLVLVVVPQWSRWILILVLDLLQDFPIGCRGVITGDLFATCSW